MNPHDCVAGECSTGPHLAGGPTAYSFHHANMLSGVMSWDPGGACRGVDLAASGSPWRQRAGSDGGVSAAPVEADHAPHCK